MKYAKGELVNFKQCQIAARCAIEINNDDSNRKAHIVNENGEKSVLGNGPWKVIIEKAENK